MPYHQHFSKISQKTTTQRSVKRVMIKLLKWKALPFPFFSLDSSSRYVVWCEHWINYSSSKSFSCLSSCFPYKCGEENVHDFLQFKIHWNKDFPHFINFSCATEKEKLPHLHASSILLSWSSHRKISDKYFFGSAINSSSWMDKGVRFSGKSISISMYEGFIFNLRLGREKDYLEHATEGTTLMKFYNFHSHAGN